MSKDTIKRWKSKIRQEGSIWRSEGSGRPKKLNNEHHLFILNLLHSSPFNTSKRIVYKPQNKFGLKVDRSTVSRFLVERGFKWKGPQVVFRNNEVDQKSILEFCKENGRMQFLLMKHRYISYLQVSKDGFHQEKHTKESKRSILKSCMFGMPLVLRE